MTCLLGLAAACTLAFVTTSCQGPATPKTPDVEAGQPERIDRGPSSYGHPVGALSQYDVEETFRGIYGDVQRCARRGARRIPELAGAFKISMRIGTDGSASEVYLSESTLGDRATETCILELVRSTPWPRAVGGTGDAEHGFSIESNHPVAEWPEHRVRPYLARIRRETTPCWTGMLARFTVTLYVGSDGRVLAAGVASPNAEAEQQADCLVERLLQLKLRRHNDRTVKVTFRIP